MKIDKTIRIPWGGCTEEIVWTVGDNSCYICGTYPEPQTKNLAKDEICGEPAWKVLLNLIGKNLPENL